MNKYNQKPIDMFNKQDATACLIYKSWLLASGFDYSYKLGF